MTEKELIEENGRLKGLLWFAWREFNAIRAQSGAPLNYHGMTGISHEYWDEMTEYFAKAIGSENTTPWMSEDARKIYSDHENG